MFTRAVTAILISSVLVGCGSDGSKDEGSTPKPTTTSSAVQSEVVGEWQRVTTCQERVAALKMAGLGRFAAEHAAGEGWIPEVTDVDQLKEPKQPCEGAVPLLHGHFFTADGLFGSRDADGNQVDDGTFDLTDEDTLRISTDTGYVTFDFEIRDNRLFLTPVLPTCAKDGCFDAQWAVAVAYPGLPWKRVE